MNVYSIVERLDENAAKTPWGCCLPLIKSNLNIVICRLREINIFLFCSLENNLFPTQNAEISKTSHSTLCVQTHWIFQL